MANDRQAVQRGLVLGLFVLVVFTAAAALVLWVSATGADRDRAIERLALTTARQAAVADYKLCVQAKKNRDAIRAQISKGDPLNLKPGQYGYSYAASHPAEALAEHTRLLQALEDAERGVGPLADFAPIKCPPDPERRRNG